MVISDRNANLLNDLAVHKWKIEVNHAQPTHVSMYLKVFTIQKEIFIATYLYKYW